MQQRANHRQKVCPLIVNLAHFGQTPTAYPMMNVTLIIWSTNDSNLFLSFITVTTKKWCFVLLKLGANKIVSDNVEREKNPQKKLFQMRMSCNVSARADLKSVTDRYIWLSGSNLELDTKYPRYENIHHHN